MGAFEALKHEVPQSLSEQRERLLDLLDESSGTMVEHGCPAKQHFEDWDLDGLAAGYQRQFGIKASGLETMTDAQQIAEKLFADAESVLRRREKEIGELLFLRLFRNLFLQEIDNQWLEHLQNMDALRDGIGLRGYGQRDPKKEYQKEGFEYFLELMQLIKSNVLDKMFHLEIEREEEVERLEEKRREGVEERQRRMRASHDQAAAEGEGGGEPQALSRRQRRRAAAQGAAQGGDAPVAAARAQTVKRDKPKLGRTEPCWCGSGKKYKQCHLRSDQDSVSA